MVGARAAGCRVPGRAVTYVWNRDAHYALRAAGRLRNPVPTPFRWAGTDLVVTATKVHGGYGKSSSGQAYLVHEVASVHLAWRRGKLVAAGAFWKCRAFTMAFTLLPGPAAPSCPACAIQRVPRPTRAR